MPYITISLENFQEKDQKRIGDVWNTFGFRAESLYSVDHLAGTTISSDKNKKTSNGRL